MGFSPLADMSRRIPDVGRSSPRQAKVIGFTVHHQAGVDMFSMATAPGYEVAAQYWITNNGVTIPNIDEDRRAWTTGAAGYPAGAESDHRNITVEVSNSPEGVRTGSWAISAAAEAALSALIGDVFKRYKLGPVKRGTVGGVAVHQDFVPTQCPGPYIMGRLDSIISAAETHRIGGEKTTKDSGVIARKRKRKNMLFIYLKDGAGKGRNQFAVFVLGQAGTWWEFNGLDSANQLASQLGSAMSVSKGVWDDRKAKHS